MNLSRYPVSIRQIQYALAVQEFSGFRAAALRCAISQPALSQQIAELEMQLGLKLFERSHATVKITQDGKKVLSRMKVILHATDDLFAEVAQYRDLFAGELSVGVIQTVAPYLLPQLVWAAKKNFPALRFTWSEMYTHTIREKLESYELDAAIVALESDLGTIAHHKLYKDYFALALPQAHPLFKKTSLIPSDLARQELLLLEEGHCFREQVLSFCQKHRARPSRLKLSQLSTITQMIEAELGLSLLPSVSIKKELSQTKLKTRFFSQQNPYRTLAFIWRPQNPREEVYKQLGLCFERSIINVMDSLTVPKNTSTRMKKAKKKGA